MKIISFIGLLFASAVVCKAQTIKDNKLPAQKDNQKSQVVKVKNWAEAIFLFPPDYWDNGTDKKAEEITSQIGSSEFEKVKMFSNQNNIPCEFLIFCETRDGSAKKNIDSLRNKLGKLIAYKIASFTHTNHAGEDYRMVVIKVPYEINKTWDTKAKWETVYFVLPESEIL